MFPVFIRSSCAQEQINQILGLMFLLFSRQSLLSINPFRQINVLSLLPKSLVSKMRRFERQHLSFHPLAFHHIAWSQCGCHYSQGSANCFLRKRHHKYYNCLWPAKNITIYNQIHNSCGVWKLHRKRGVISKSTLWTGEMTERPKLLFQNAWQWILVLKPQEEWKS